MDERSTTAPGARASGGPPPPPLSDPAEGRPPVARALLAAAQRIIEERGFPALSLESIARESGENKAMVAYYYGNKAGLVAAILDSIIFDECSTIARRLEGVSGREERLKVMLEGMLELTAPRERFHGFFDILPHALRDATLRSRLVDLYEWYVVVELDWLGLDPGPAAAELEPREAAAYRRRVRGLVELIVAAADGIGIQARIDPGTFDSQRAYEVLELLVRRSWDEFETSGA